MLWAIAQWTQAMNHLPFQQRLDGMAIFAQAWRLLPAPQDVVNDWQTAIASTISAWFDDHPLLAWSLDHPVVSAIGFIISLLFLLSFVQLIIEMTRQLWLIILQLPLQLARWLSIGIASLLKFSAQRMSHVLRRSLFRNQRDDPYTPRTSESAPVEPPLSPMSNISVSDQAVAFTEPDIAQLLYRLEELAEEQTQILHQIARLTEAKS
jgi:hypothetical protein